MKHLPPTDADELDRLLDELAETTLPARRDELRTLIKARRALERQQAATAANVGADQMQAGLWAAQVEVKEAAAGVKEATGQLRSLTVAQHGFMNTVQDSLKTSERKAGEYRTQVLSGMQGIAAEQTQQGKAIDRLREQHTAIISQLDEQFGTIDRDLAELRSELDTASRQAQARYDALAMEVGALRSDHHQLKTDFLERGKLLDQLIKEQRRQGKQLVQQGKALDQYNEQVPAHERHLNDLEDHIAELQAEIRRLREGGDRG